LKKDPPQTPPQKLIISLLCFLFEFEPCLQPRFNKIKQIQVFKGGGAGEKRGEALEQGIGNKPLRNPSFCKKLGRWGTEKFSKIFLPHKTTLILR